jgi:hypothetical protein
MTIDKITEQNLAKAAELLRYQNKQQEIHRMEEQIKEERLRLERMKPVDPTKGSNVDVSV